MGESLGFCVGLLLAVSAVYWWLVEDHRPMPDLTEEIEIIRKMERDRAQTRADIGSPME